MKNDAFEFTTGILDNIIDLPNFIDIESEFISGNFANDEKENINGLPGGYCTVYGDASKLSDLRIAGHWPTVNCVIPEKNFVGDSSNSLHAIAKTIFKPGFNQSQYTFENYSADEGGAVYSIFNLEYGVFIDNVFEGIIYTKLALENGKPVVFGVNSVPVTTTDNWDGSTNNHLLIVGMGNDGRNYFLAWDNSTPYRDSHIVSGIRYEGGTSTLNKLYFDHLWQGLLRADCKWQNVYSSLRQPYIITQIIRTKKHS